MYVYWSEYGGDFRYDDAILDDNVFVDADDYYIFLYTFVDANYCVQVWHDIACYHKKSFVCEDSDTLMEFAKQTSPALAPRI
jgi:hypothetical protein